MSHELLLVSGHSDSSAREHRRRLLEQAAGQVPGAVTWEMFEDERTAVALVQTQPDGGSSAIFVRAGGTGLSAVVATSPTAAQAAHDGAAGQGSGAEHGHVRVLVDSADGTIHVSTDGTGVIPSFWRGGRDDFVFATHLASLVSLGAAPTLDDTGAVEYLLMLQPLGTRTVLAEAALLPAGGALRVVPGSTPRLMVERLYVPCPEGMGDTEAVAEFARVWREVTDDLLTRTRSDRLTLGLSGGVDSRAIAVECVRAGRRPHAFTYGDATTAPARVAAQVAGLLHLDHTLLQLTDERLLPTPGDGALLLDGAHSPAEMYELWFGPALKEFADVVVNGHGGGSLWGDEKALGISDHGAILDNLERRYASELDAITPFLEAGVADSARDALQASLTASLEPWEPWSRSDIASFWNVNNRQFRWGNMLSTALRRSGLRLEAPFMDSRLLRLSARLTPEQRMNGRLYLRVHREVFAETAGVVRSDDGNSPRHLSHLYWSGESSFGHQLAELARQHPISALRRGTRRVKSNVARHLGQHGRGATIADRYESRQSVFPGDVWMRTNEQYRSRLLDFLSGSAVPAMLSSSAVERAAEQLAVGDARSGALRLARIATLQAWHQDFDRRARALESVR